jgi:heme exporter protein B
MKIAARDNWWRETWAVFVKDARSEWRTKSAISTILMFALTTIVLVAFMVQTRGPGLTQWWVEEEGRMVLRTVETPNRAALLSALYWVILYFSAMAGLPRAFAKEEEMRTAAALRLTARPLAVLGGKLLFNLALLEAVALLVLPLFVLFFEPRVASWPLLLGHLVVGAAAMAGTATLLGAIVARAGNRGYLMLILGFGPLLPVLIFSINGTTAALHGDSGNNLLPLVSYLVMMAALSGALFDRVWSD